MPPPDEQDLPNQHNSKEGSVPIIQQNAKNIYNFGTANNNKFGDCERQLTSQVLQGLVHENTIQDLSISLSGLEGDLQRSHKQVELLVNYSQISNLFLRLKSECQDVIVQQTKLNTLDEISLDLLKTCHEQTNNIIRKFIEIEDNLRKTNISCNFNFIWLENIKTANAIVEEICQNTKKSNHKQRLENANEFIVQILNIYPCKFNVELNAVASHLNLLDLIEKSKNLLVGQEISNYIGSEKYNHIQTKINLLYDLNVKFIKVIEINSLWQEIKQNLEKLVISENNYINLEIHKIHIINLSNIQYDNLDKNWQIKFKDDCNNFIDAISNKDSIKIQRYFQIYQNNVKRHFYRSSTELQELCNELQLAINVLLSMINLIKS